MIYKREEYLEENEQDERFPLKRVEVLTPTEGGTKRFTGHVALGVQTPMGVQQLPVAFEIEAANIEEAFQKFAETAEPRIEEVRKGIESEIQRMRQEQAGRIVTPGEAGMGGGKNVIDFGKLKE